MLADKSVTEEVEATADRFTINTVEEAVLYMFCREPKAVVYFDCPAEDILSPISQMVVGAAQQLHAQRKPPIIENIAAMTGQDIKKLERWGRMVTARMREDWPQYAPLIRLAAQKRRLIEFYVEMQEAALRAPLLSLPKLNADARMRFTLLTTDVQEKKTSEIGDIIVEMETRPVLVLDPIPTGVDIIDQVLNGGPRPKQVHVIAGAMKAGKTMLARNIAENMGDARVTHIAADGGSKYEHVCSYIGMRAKRHCLKAGISTEVYGVRGDALHPDNIAIWLSNRNPQYEPRELLVPIVPQVEQALLAGRDEFVALREHGHLGIFDAEMLGFSIDSLLLFIEREYYINGTQVVIIDHAGKFGDKRKMRIFDRLEMNAQLLVELFNRLPLVGIILSQRNAAGVAKHSDGVEDEDDDSDYSANLEGGKVWEQEAHSIWIVRRPKGKHHLLVKPKLLRKAENDVATAKIPVHLPSGLIIPEWAR